MLIQRATRRVRKLRGRYLHVRVTLTGDHRTTPEIAALRAYASRFSYVEHYLPELYQETEFGADAGRLLAPGETSTRADFLDRFVANFEGVLTPLEDRVAAAYLLTDPRTVPEASLEWLAGWLGQTFDPAVPVCRRRRILQETPKLYREHGTLSGLRRALDLATGGGVTRGDIVVLEDFRLRRTFATILGADLADEDDPLLGGLAVSGNSFVGDTLFLGEEDRKEFLALFGADLPVSASEQAAIAALFDRLAHRVTVLVREDVHPQDVQLIERVSERETPAHVQARVITATRPFMVGIASLVGVDSYLSTPPEPEPVRVDRSTLGVRDHILRLPSLDPRLGSPELIARVDGPAEVHIDAPFMLDASGSRSGPPNHIARMRWTLDQ